MRRKNRYKEIKIKPKTYRISGKGNKSIFTDICGIIATFIIILFVMWLRKNGYMIFNISQRLASWWGPHAPPIQPGVVNML